MQEGNPMGDNSALAAKFEEVLRTNDFGKMTEVTKEYATDDFHTDWPQSGERLSRDAAIRMSETYAEETGKSPKFTYKRMVGGGDIYVVEGTIDYGDGIPVSYVGIGELQDGRIARMTEYFANPFEAPAWRADFVEKIPASA
jgi:hypothetical protein